MSSINTSIQGKASNAWKISKVIAEGVSNIIAVIYNEEMSQYSVAKILTADETALITYFEAEARIHRELDHPKIVKFEDFQKNLCLVDSEGNEVDVVAIRTRYAENGDLFDLLCNFIKMPLLLVRSYARQMVEAVAYLHEKKIAHRDLKLENFLLDSDFKVQLADFGNSCKTDHDCQLTELVGTYQYLAPEQFEGVPYNGFDVDVFSLGISIFMLATGRAPFEKATQDDEYYIHFINGEENEFWDKHEKLYSYSISQTHFSQGFRDLINGMLKYKTSSRMTIYEILNHPWLQMIPMTIEKGGGLVKEFLKKKGVIF